MKPTHVVESRKWVNRSTGQTASVYGAVPYRNEAEKPQWAIITVGYTLAFDNGTVGYGRPPLKTREEAEEKLRSWA